MFLFLTFLIFISSPAVILNRGTHPFVVEKFICVIVFYFSWQVTRDSVLKHVVVNFAQIGRMASRRKRCTPSLRLSNGCVAKIGPFC